MNKFYLQYNSGDTVTESHKWKFNILSKDITSLMPFHFNKFKLELIYEN